MAINPYAWPALAGTKFRAVNLCNHPNDSGNGGFGVPAPFYDFWYDWPWTTWIKPQIDAAAALGCNCIRVMSDATVRYGDVSHHGAATWRGTITSGAFAAQWDQLITYCASLGIYVYATATESRPVASSGMSKANLTSYLEEFVGVVSSAAYNNVPALDLVQEWTQGGTVVTDTGNLEDLIAAAKAALIKPLPVTCSQNGAADSGDLDYDTDLALQRIAFSGVDFVDVHVYYFAPVSDYYPLFGPLAIVSMERGIDYNGGFTSGPTGGGSAAAREAFYDQFEEVAHDYRLQANGAWAITRQSTTDDGNDWGLFGITQDASPPYAFTDERTEMTTQFKSFPKTIQPRDPAVDPGPTVAPPPTHTTITSTTIPLTWDTADGGTGTITYTPQYIAADDDGFPIGMTWTDGPSTTSTAATLSGLAGYTRYLIRIKVTDSASSPVTTYSSWLEATTGEFMSLQLSTAVRNARLDSIETTIGTAAVLKIRTGAQPADVATADSGTVLATLSLPSDWMAAAASGSKAKSGTWQDASADASGTAAHFRIYASDGTTCHIQGTVTATGGGGDMTVDNVVFASGQGFTVTGFSLTDGNA